MPSGVSFGEPRRGADGRGPCSGCCGNLPASSGIAEGQGIRRGGERTRAGEYNPRAHFVTVTLQIFAPALVILEKVV